MLRLEGVPTSNFQGTYQGSYGHKGTNIAYTVDMLFCIDATRSMEDMTGSQQKIVNVGTISVKTLNLI